MQCLTKKIGYRPVLTKREGDGCASCVGGQKKSDAKSSVKHSSSRSSPRSRVSRKVASPDRSSSSSKISSKPSSRSSSGSKIKHHQDPLLNHLVAPKCHLPSACRAELGRYPLIFDINERILKYISYLQSKEQSSLVIQSLVMSIDLHRNGKTSFYTNLIKMFNYCNTPFNCNNDNLDDTKIMHFVDHMQKKYITHWKHSLCNSQKLEYYNVFKDSYTPSIYLDVTRKILIEKHL